jgi:ABC-type sugar transport system substrate-binding protein
VRIKNRLRKPSISPARSLVLSLAPALLVLAALLVLQVNVDRAIGSAGALFAILTFAVQQLQSRNPPGRTVIFLPKSRSSFARNISRGLTECVSRQTGLQLRAVFPDDELADPCGWQLGRLQSKDVRDADAVVIIPAEDDERLWQQLAKLVRSGVFVVAVDMKPPNKTFVDSGVSRPHFVGSDFSGGGEMIADLIAEGLRQDSQACAVLALGPDFSWPARERSSRILYRLAALDLARRVRAVHLVNWNAKACAAAVVPEAIDLQQTHGGRVHIFCGNDKILVAVYAQLVATVPSAAVPMFSLVGYDGATNEDNSLLISDCPIARATIDTLPQQQGRVAGEFILESYDGKQTVFTTRLIEPTLQELAIAR